MLIRPTAMTGRHSPRAHLARGWRTAAPRRGPLGDTRPGLLDEVEAAAAQRFAEALPHERTELDMQVAAMPVCGSAASAALPRLGSADCGCIG